MYIFHESERIQMHTALGALRAFYAKAKEREEAFETCSMDQYRLEDLVLVTFTEQDGQKNCGLVNFHDFTSTGSKVQKNPNISAKIKVRTLLGAIMDMRSSDLEVVTNRLVATSMFILEEYCNPEGSYSLSKRPYYNI